VTQSDNILSIIQCHTVMKCYKYSRNSPRPNSFDRAGHLCVAVCLDGTEAVSSSGFVHLGTAVNAHRRLQASLQAVALILHLDAVFDSFWIDALIYSLDEEFIITGMPHFSLVLLYSF